MAKILRNGRLVDMPEDMAKKRSEAVARANYNREKEAHNKRQESEKLGKAPKKVFLESEVVAEVPVELPKEVEVPKVKNKGGRPKRVWVAKE